MATVDTRPDDFDSEEYRADARYWIDWMLANGFDQVPLSNDTAAGRVHAELTALLRDVDTLDFPVSKRRWASIAYMVGDGSLNHLRAFADGAPRLYWVLGGEGLLKPRHYPRVAELAVECIDRIEIALPVPAPAKTAPLIAELKAIAGGFFNSTMQLPQAKDAWPVLRSDIENINDQPKLSDQMPGLLMYELRIWWPLTGYRRPRKTSPRRTHWPDWLVRSGGN